MSRRSAKRQRGRATPSSESHTLLDELGLPGPTLPLAILILVIGFSPLLVLSLVEVGDTTRRLLAALGPVLVCLAFSVLIVLFGLRAAEGEAARIRTWFLFWLFLALGGLFGWGLYVSV